MIRSQHTPVRGQGFIISDLGLIFLGGLGTVAFATAGWGALVLAWAALVQSP